MRPLRLLTVLALASLVLAAGCGGDDDEDNPSQPTTTGRTEQPQTGDGDGGSGEPVGGRGGKEAADAFVACFKEPGFEAIRGPSARQPGAIVANEKGYETESLLMSSDGGVNSFFMTFFESEADREKAVEALDLDFGSADVPQALESGSAVVGFVTKQVQSDVGAKVEECLGA